MKQRLFFFFVIFLFLTGTGCEKVIEFTGEETEPRLTVSSRAEVGEPLEAYIAASVFFLYDSSDPAVFLQGLDPARGQVCCYVNGSATPRPFEYVPKENASSLCFRALDYAPAPGDHIRLEVEFPGFDPVWAETDVPREPAFEIVSVKPETTNGVELTLALTDDGSYDKFYFLQPLLQTWESSLDRNVFWTLSFSSNDVIFYDMSGTSAFEALDEETGNYFSDDLIKGKRHVFVITVPYWKNESTHLWIHGAAIDESLYGYGTSYGMLMAMDEWTSFFSEGVTLYSNVHGGYGVFGAAASRWLEVEW